VKVLLDTCALLWLAESPANLSASARSTILHHSGELYVSAISAFEIGLKHRKGRLNLGMEPDNWWRLATAHHGLTVVSISDGIALASTALPPLHSDPSDRLIVATAAFIQAPIVTSDPLIRQYPNIHVIW